jgi:hypothetical protein
MVPDRDTSTRWISFKMWENCGKIPEFSKFCDFFDIFYTNFAISWHFLKKWNVGKCGSFPTVWKKVSVIPLVPAEEGQQDSESARTCGTPVDETNWSLGLDHGNGGVDVLGDDVASVEQATGHILSAAGVTLDHLGVRFEALLGDIEDLKTTLIIHLNMYA